MEAFSITCTTCHSRLKVRDPEVIGDILACPKCGGMVLVEAPPGWQGESIAPAVTARKQQAAEDAALRDTVDGEIHTDRTPAKTAPAKNPPAESAPGTTDASLFDVEAFPEEMLHSAPTRSSGVKQADGDAPTVESLDIEGRDSRPASQPADTDAGEPAESAEESNATEAASAIEDEDQTPEIAAEEMAGFEGSASPMLPDDQWVSPATQQRKQIMLMIGASVGGVMVALAVFGIALSQLGATGGQPVAGVNPGSDVIHVDAAPVPGNTKIREVVSADGSAATTGSGDPSPTPAKPDPEDPATSPPVAVTPPDKKPAVTDVEPTPPQPPAVEPPTEKGPGEDAADGADTVEDGNPPELDPEAAAKSDQPPGLEDILGDFAPFMESGPVAPPANAAPKDPEDEDEPEIEPVDPSKPPTPEPLQVDIEARLADSIPAISFSNAKLIDFIRLMSNLTNIPISIDPVGLKMAIKSPQSPVSVNLKNATVGNILTNALKPLRLTIRQGKDHLLVTFYGGEQQRQIKYSAKGLAQTDEELAALVSIARDITADASTWKDNGGTAILSTGENSLVVKHHMPVHFQVLLLLEKLRVARGVAPSTSLGGDLVRMQTRRSQAAPLLSKQLNINYHELTSLVKILHRVEDETRPKGESSLKNETGLTILVDWPALLEKGWTPATEASLTVEKESVESALTKLLAPYDATFKVIDQKTLQVTTTEQANLENEIEIYSVAGLVAGESSPQQLMNRLRVAAGAGNFRTGGGAAVLRYDPVSRALIVAAPQPLQVQIDALLLEWAKEAG